MKELERTKLIELARKYNVLELWHYGSSVSNHGTANDIDIAVILNDHQSLNSLRDDINHEFSNCKIDMQKYHTIENTGNPYHFLVCTKKIMNQSEYRSIIAGNKLWEL